MSLHWRYDPDWSQPNIFSRIRIKFFFLGSATYVNTWFSSDLNSNSWFPFPVGVQYTRTLRQLFRNTGYNRQDHRSLQYRTEIVFKGTVSRDFWSSFFLILTHLDPCKIASRHWTMCKLFALPWAKTVLCWDLKANI